MTQQKSQQVDDKLAQTQALTLQRYSTYLKVNSICIILCEISGKYLILFFLQRNLIYYNMRLAVHKYFFE